MEKKYIATIQDVIQQWRITPEKLAVQFIEEGEIQKKSFQDLYNEVMKLSQLLCERGYSNKHVAIVGENSYKWTCAWFAITNIGGVAVAISKDLNTEQFLEHINFADCVAVLYTNDMKDEIDFCIPKNKIDFLSLEEINVQNTAPIYENEKQYINVQPEDVATILYTSGTTGKPKAVMLSHENLLNHYLFGHSEESFSKINVFLVMPFHHIMSLEIMVIALAYNATISICSSLKYFIRDLTRMKPDEMMLVPQLIQVLCGYIEKTESLANIIKHIYSAGASLPTLCWEILEKNHIVLTQNYGATETAGEGISCVVTEENCKTLGKSYQDTEVRIIDGEIALKGHTIMKGYYKNPDETNAVLKDGWFYTGDLGYMDNTGNVFMTGRKKNLIILSNGENINPEEIENILSNSSEIQEIMVFEMQDKLCAEVFPAFTQDEEIQKETIEMFIKEYNKTVPTYRQIRKVLYRSTEFEKTATNKIKRVLIKE